MRIPILLAALMHVGCGWGVSESGTDRVVVEHETELQDEIVKLQAEIDLLRTEIAQGDAALRDAFTLEYESVTEQLDRALTIRFVEGLDDLERLVEHRTYQLDERLSQQEKDIGNINYRVWEHTASIEGFDEKEEIIESLAGDVSASLYTLERLVHNIEGQSQWQEYRFATFLNTICEEFGPGTPLTLEDAISAFLGHMPVVIGIVGHGNSRELPLVCPNDGFSDVMFNVGGAWWGN